LPFSPSTIVRKYNGPKRLMHGIVGDEGNDAHLALALRADQRVDFKNLADHLCPAPAGDHGALLLNDDEWMLVGLPLPHFPPVSIGVLSHSDSFGKLKLSGNPRGYDPLVAGRSPRKGGRKRSARWKGETRSGFPLQGDLAFIGNMGSDPGDELQVIHPLHLFSSFPILVADLPFFFIEGETFQGQKRPDHVFPDPFGLLNCEILKSARGRDIQNAGWLIIQQFCWICRLFHFRQFHTAHDIPEARIGV